MSTIMSDEELINYCDLHSETERALFHTSHIKRMLVLAGRDVSSVQSLDRDTFYSMHDTMKMLVHEARKRKAKRAAIKKGTDHLSTGGYRAWATYKYHHIEATGPDEEVAEAMVAAALQVITDG